MNIYNNWNRPWNLNRWFKMLHLFIDSIYVAKEKLGILNIPLVLEQRNESNYKPTNDPKGFTGFLTV